MRYMITISDTHTIESRGEVSFYTHAVPNIQQNSFKIKGSFIFALAVYTI